MKEEGYLWNKCACKYCFVINPTVAFDFGTSACIIVPAEISSKRIRICTKSNIILKIIIFRSYMYWNLVYLTCFCRNKKHKRNIFEFYLSLIELMNWLNVTFLFHVVNLHALFTTVLEQAQTNRSCNICNFIVLGFLQGFLFLYILLYYMLLTMYSIVWFK